MAKDNPVLPATEERTEHPPKILADLPLVAESEGS
jgi:hypothetical protein